MLSLNKLEIFALVVETGSFSAAAERLLLTQPAVSQHIQDIEAMLGVQLFTRGRRGVALTPPGETLYAYSQRILRLVLEAESAVTDVRHIKSGQTRIGATPGVSMYLLPGWIRTFQHAYPNLTLALETAVTSKVLAGVLTHELDIGIIEGELDRLPTDGLTSLALRDIDMYVIVGTGHDWCQHASVPIAALDGQPFITRTADSQTRRWIDTLMAEHGVAPRIVAEFDNPEAIKQAVASGIGITILPGYAVFHEQARKVVRTVELDDVNLGRTLKLVWDEHRPFSPVTKALLTHLTAEFPQLAPFLETTRGQL
ncbi:MAG: LysR family transcriptional regulator [Anaerolineaceae bacterium]|nr:LysR family transcriptional regulator [Anaerolineaceae bacterium]